MTIENIIISRISRLLNASLDRISSVWLYVAGKKFCKMLSISLNVCLRKNKKCIWLVNDNDQVAEEVPIKGRNVQLVQNNVHEKNL